MISDLQKIIKRLELIRNLIVLSEEAEIEEQILKLQELSPTDDLNIILNSLKQKLFQKASLEIETFISAHSQILTYQDPEINALKLEAKSLENLIQEESANKATLEKLIHTFSLRYNQELGELMIELLKKRKAIFANTDYQKKSEEEYESFYSNYSEIVNEIVIELSNEELISLKEKYRKASKLCHPDVVADEFKLKAQEIFAELNKAYEKNDLKQVSEILNSLLTKEAFISCTDLESKKETLIKEINRLRRTLDDIRSRILEIKESDTFKTISNVNNWELYFAEKKEQLKQQLDLLK